MISIMKYKKGVTIVNTLKNLYKYSRKYTIHDICLPLNVPCIDLRTAELLRWFNMNAYPMFGFEQSSYVWPVRKRYRLDVMAPWCVYSHWQTLECFQVSFSTTISFRKQLNRATSQLSENIPLRFQHCQEWVASTGIFSLKS